MSTNLHIDYFGNLILRDGKLGLSVSSQYVTPPYYGGGRVGALCPYAVEQVNHYYAYGGIIGNLSSNEGLQEFKFGDRSSQQTGKIEYLPREDEGLSESPDRTILHIGSYYFQWARKLMELQLIIDSCS